MSEYFSCKEITEDDRVARIFKRKTKEVVIRVVLYKNNRILLEGMGDCEHHLLEDSAILIKKVLGGHDTL